MGHRKNVEYVVVKRVVKNVLFNSFIAETLKRVNLFEDGINILSREFVFVCFFLLLDGIALSEKLDDSD